MQRGKNISSTKEQKHDDQYLSKKWEPPKGWAKLSKGYKASDGELLESVKQVVKYLRSKGYTEEYIDKYKEEGTSLKFMNREGLPSGWRSAIVQSDGCIKGGKITMTRYLSPDGIIFLNRALAIKYMIENNLNKKDIDAMISLLKSHDGWKTDENLPNGWMKNDLITNTIYLSPTWETFRNKHH